jgi:S-adenosylmethionine-dependent methyltransferase
MDRGDANRDRLRAYYAEGREAARLLTDDGWLEHERTMALLLGELRAGSRVLDLGGGPGHATAALAAAGHRVTLIDLSPELVELAARSLARAGLTAHLLVGDALAPPVRGPFDAVLCAGPAYHVAGTDELERLARAIAALLPSSGRAFVTFMPRLAGLAGLLARASSMPEQVPPGTMTEAWRTGRFVNPADRGFCEAWFAHPDQMRHAFSAAGFRDLRILSLRGIGAPHGAGLRTLHDARPDLWDEALALIEQTADLPEVIALSAHAMLLGTR